jgi:integrase
MRGHIRQRSNGSWEIRYDYGTDPATGKRRIATATVRGDRKAAEKELRRLLHTLDDGEHVDPTRISVKQWLEQWLETVKTEVAPKTFERYDEIARQFLMPALGNHLLAKLSPAHIQTAYNAWAVGGRRDGKEGGLSAQTRRHIHRILRTALSRAVEQQVIARNPADAFRKRLPKVERREMLTLTADQSAKLLEALSHSRVYWPVLVALSTGMRRGEILALRWKNVDLERGALSVVESLEDTKAGIRFKKPKSGRSRAITLPSYAVEELRRLKELPRVRFHDLRHSHATQLLASGIHPKVASERLGHASIGITLDLYSHVTDTMQGEAASKLDSAMALAKSRLGGQK